MIAKSFDDSLICRTCKELSCQPLQHRIAWLLEARSRHSITTCAELNDVIFSRIADPYLTKGASNCEIFTTYQRNALDLETPRRGATGHEMMARRRWEGRFG